MFENGKASTSGSSDPGGWYTFICTTYIANAEIGFHLSWGVAYAVGAVATVAYVGIILWYGNKRSAKLNINK